MSTLTYKQATDDMYTMIKTAWDTTGHEMFYESVRDQREDDNTAWASSVIRHALGFQATLGGPSYRTFERQGVVIVSIYAPVGKGLQDSYALAKVIADAFEGKASPNGVWFKNITIQEIGRDGQFFQVNVLTEFSYTETK